MNKKFSNKTEVVGLGFGDEGKGAVVQSLCRNLLNDSKTVTVKRYCGGPNAGHTVQNNGITHVCSSFGSGTLLGVPTFIDTSTLINPMCIKEEYDALKALGIEPKISIYDYVRMITPYDVLANLEDEESIQNGTCGKGMWKTFERLGISPFSGYFVRTCCTNDIRIFLSHVAKYYGVSRKYRLENLYTEATAFVRKLSKDFEPTEYSIYESSQGILLDQTFGFQPYVSPVNVLNRFLEKDFFFVTRTYTTRHGAGYIPTMTEGFYDLSNKFESNVDNDFQGAFKVGVLDLDILNRGIDRSQIWEIPLENRNLVITHMDVPIKENKFFYKLNGVVHLIEDVDESKIANEIAKHLYIDFNEIYYLDAPDGDIKLVY